MNKGMIFRVDDVTSNTDMNELKKMVSYLHKRFVCQVWACVTPFSQFANEGSVYPEPPFKHMDRSKFYKVKQYFNPKGRSINDVKFVSHGLIHADHASLQFDAQEMSIATSCSILNTDTFVPPFNKWNQTTEAVCRQHGITLVKSDLEGWRSLEHEEFDPYHKLWYFHPWRFNEGSFKKILKGEACLS